VHRILLVEDDADVRFVMEHALVSQRYEVDTADTMDRALGLLDSRAYDLVVADARLGDGTGMAIGAKAKEFGIATLIVTAYAFSLPPHELNEFEYLLKPAHSRELLHAVARMLLES